MKQLAFLNHYPYSISKKYWTNFKPLFLAESTYFHHIPYIYLINPWNGIANQPWSLSNLHKWKQIDLLVKQSHATQTIKKAIQGSESAPLDSSLR